MTATDISLNGSLPAHGPILYDVMFLCVYPCTCLFYMSNGLNKELLNLNLNLNFQTCIVSTNSKSGLSPRSPVFEFLKL